MAASRTRVPVLALVALVLVSATACDKPDWLTRFEQRMDLAVPKLVEALDDLAKDLPRLAEKLDASLGAQIRALDTVLRESADGLNQVLTENRGRLDAALVARVEQLARFASQFRDQVRGVLAGTREAVTLSVDQILAQTEVLARGILSSLDVQIATVEREATRSVASVYPPTQDLIIRVAGGVMMVLAVIGAGVVFIAGVGRRRAVVFGIQVGLVVVVAVAGAVLVFSNAVRSRFLTADIIVDHSYCPRALTSAAVFLATYQAIEPIPPEAVVAASEVMPDLLACQATTSDRDLLDTAMSRLAGIRRVLGIDRHCLLDRDCTGGKRCDPQTGACTARCLRPTDCSAGLTCHVAIGRCAAPCADDAGCPDGSHCTTSALCALDVQVPPKRIPGGLGWDLAALCRGDLSCLRMNDSVVRDILIRR